jgi:hypothetical protein
MRSHLFHYTTGLLAVSYLFIYPQAGQMSWERTMARYKLTVWLRKSHVIHRGSKKSWPGVAKRTCLFVCRERISASKAASILWCIDINAHVHHRHCHNTHHWSPL